MPTFTEEDVAPQGGTFTADDVAHGTFTLDDIAPSPTPEVDKAVAQSVAQSVRDIRLVQQSLLIPATMPIPREAPTGGIRTEAGMQYEADKSIQEGNILEKPVKAVGQYVAGMVPTSLDQALRMENVPTNWQDPEQIATFVAPALKMPFDMVHQVISRAKQIQEADKTPPFSQERWNAAIGTGLDVAGMAALIKGVPEMFREPVARPEGGSATLTPPEAQTQPQGPGSFRDVPSGAEAAPLVQSEAGLQEPLNPQEWTPRPSIVPQPSVIINKGPVSGVARFQYEIAPGTQVIETPEGPIVVPLKPTQIPEELAKIGSEINEGEPPRTITQRFGGGDVNAQQPSNAQVETGDTALGEQARPEGNVSVPSSSDNVIGETGGEKPLVEGEAPQEDVAVAQPEGGGEPAEPAAVSGAETPPAAEPQRAATSLQNAVTEAERVNRGLGPREAVESQSWDKAKSIAQSEAAADPGKGARLVEELNQQPRALDDVEGVHLLNRKVEVNREFDNALENLRRNPEDVDAIARMTKAREDAYKMYQATEASGTAWGRGGRIRQAMMADDYSMSRMEATRRVANKGKPLSTSQMMEVADHYSKISKQEARIKVAEDSLQTPSGRMRPQEILNAVEQMKRRLTPCL